MSNAIKQSVKKIPNEISTDFLTNGQTMVGTIIPLRDCYRFTIDLKGELEEIIKHEEMWANPETGKSYTLFGAINGMEKMMVDIRTDLNLVLDEKKTKDAENHKNAELLQEKKNEENPSK